MEKRKRLRIIIAAAALVGIVSLCALEIVLRAIGHLATWSEKNGGEYISAYGYRNPEPWLHVGKPGRVYTFAQPEFDFEVRLNSHGLRDVEHPVDKPAGEYRVVGLGDSFMMGQGAAFRDTCLQELERLAAGRGVRTIAGGFAGSDPVFCLELLKRRLLGYGPDLVLLLINESDISDIITRGGLDRFDNQGYVAGPPAPAMEGIYRRSFLFRAVIQSRLFGYSWELLSPTDRARQSEDAMKVIAEAAREIRDLGAKRGFRLLVISHPYDYALRLPDSPGMFGPLGEELARYGIAYLDLTPYCRERVPPEAVDEYFWPIDGHCTAKGYALFARGIYERIDAMLPEM